MFMTTPRRSSTGRASASPQASGHPPESGAASSALRFQQLVEAALALLRRLQARVAQTAVVFELHGAVDVSGLHQQFDGRRLRLARGLEIVGLVGAAVDGNDLGADGEAGVESRAVQPDLGDRKSGAWGKSV